MEVSLKIPIKKSKFTINRIVLKPGILIHHKATQKFPTWTLIDWQSKGQNSIQPAASINALKLSQSPTVFKNATSIYLGSMILLLAIESYLAISSHC